MSASGNPDSGTPANVWEQTIFSAFSSQIKEHIGEKIHGAIAGDFSTTTAVSRAVHEVTLMSAMKHYFSYGCSTCCGIPNITLLGTEDDWVELRARAEALGDLMTPGLSSKWMPVLLPVLDEFVAGYKGQVNHGFWQSMVKLRYRGGSGARSEVSGWLQILYPYLKGGHLNTDLRPWHQMYFTGPDPANIPPIVSSAPVDWDYYGTTYDLHFNAGFAGCQQDSDGTLTPVLGWFVCHDPPTEPKERLKVIDNEIEALVKGHEEEAREASIDKKQPWFVRVTTLFYEQKSIYEWMNKKIQDDKESINREREHCSWYSERQKRELADKIGICEKEEKKLDAAPKFESVEDAILAVLEEMRKRVA